MAVLSRLAPKQVTVAFKYMFELLLILSLQKPKAILQKYTAQTGWASTNGP